MRGAQTCRTGSAIRVIASSCARPKSSRPAPVQSKAEGLRAPSQPLGPSLCCRRQCTYYRRQRRLVAACVAWTGERESVCCRLSRCCTPSISREALSGWKEVTESDASRALLPPVMYGRAATELPAHSGYLLPSGLGEWSGSPRRNGPTVGVATLQAVSAPGKEVLGYTSPGPARLKQPALEWVPANAPMPDRKG
jgi:hypothetical protein